MRISYLGCTVYVVHLSYPEIVTIVASEHARDPIVRAATRQDLRNAATGSEDLGCLQGRELITLSPAECAILADRYPV